MRLLSALAVLGFLGMATAGDKPKTGFVDKTFKNADGSESPYVVFVPHTYDGTKPVPVILFLHGAGETKGGKMLPVQQGLAPHIKGRREKTFPAIVIIPQAESARTKVGGRWYADAPDGKRALAMLDATMKEYKVDPDRQYLTGLSMGGFGTWHMAFSHPDRWAAIVPICGGGDPKGAEKFKDIPCWAWHGGDDKVVRPELSRQMVEALKKAGGEPRYTELEYVGHNSWDSTYATEDLYAWLFRQSKKKK
ncbi:MAG TPA: alpha/beta hydrolase-fold protein [Fimbriiglobus sp.]|nr:alpha/beta hydrolase-fold protein [Fimbriiglobus sp.]